jgi:phosphoglucosamine mutase
MFVDNFFGTSGIRGVIGKEIDEKFSYKIGLALGKYIKRGKALIAYDPRPGAKEISEALIKGLKKTKVEVTNLEILPTPELTWYQVKGDYHLGVSVTGSHLPWNMIGIIPTLKDGDGIYGQIGEKITQIYGSL